ncbi:chromosome partition protein Smc [Clostridium sp. CAG:508]|jgi:chromosome segregation protein|nr:chromosome partition protein Smc [Clostridium sp. CAG:508]
MYLKRIEMQGFKSFADKTVLEFKPGITTVIGPNGSGKSNISDAIRWVLGEQSMKSLRGAKSEDIIFAGTQARKSLGFAEVSIVIDNNDNKLPIEYSEVTVTRKIYRSGETGYFINKVPCRLKDILELFMDTGIGKDGYSIIGQGKIDEILSNKSEDRRHIFEEAAGIVKYRTRKQESEKKLEQTKLNLLRINDILAEIEANIEPLKLQSDKAKQFLDLREELKSIEVGLFIYNINTYKEKLEQLVKDEDIITSQKEAEDSKMEALQASKEELRQVVDDITAQIENMQNIGFESSNKIEKINSEIGISNERIQNNSANKQRLEAEILEVKNRIEELKEEQKQKLEKKTNLTSNKEKFEKELAEKEAELAELSKKLSAKELEIEGKKQIVQDNIDKKYELAAEINTQDVNYENLEKRKKQLKNEIDSVISELDSTRYGKNEISKGFYDIESKRNIAVENLEKSVQAKEQNMQKLKQYEEEISKLTYTQRMKQARHQFLIETEKEKEGYNKTVKSLLVACDKDSSLNKGIHGVLANLISVEKEYETAIEMCLGQSLQNVVTSTEQDAKKMIEYLRSNSLGRASFLPIASVQGKKLDKLTKMDGVIGIASDLVKCKKEYEQIILSLLGRTVVVEDMDTAIALAKKDKYSFRIVTLKGDIISSSGSISGGSVQTKTVNILGRSREIEDLEKELKKLEKQIADKTAEKEEYASSIGDSIEETAKLEKELQEIEIVYATEKQKMVAVEENITRLENRLAKLKEELTQTEKQKEENRLLKEQKEAEIQALTQQIEELNKVIEEFALNNKDNQKYIDDLNFDITNLKISVTSFDESESSIEEMVERISQDIKNNEQSIENKNQNILAITEENTKLEQTITEYNNQIEQIKQEVTNSGTKVEELKQERIAKNEKLVNTENEIQSQFSTLESLKEQIIKLDVKKTKLEQDLQQVVESLWNEYELTPNSTEEYQKPNNVATAQKQVNSLRNKIKDLGSINIDSIEEYKKTKERYDFMSEQRLDLENTASKLRKIIGDMTTTMQNQFKEKFELINKNFNEVFTELFNGGKAELILENEENILECGIDIRVQPPGKKLQNMMLLSGGEKAFTAIALLFAILKINPAPFCILDEIEAALDDVNVYRFAEYLKKFCKQTQFLVITHRKGTMEAGDSVYGVTMEENGISKLLSIKLK